MEGNGLLWHQELALGRRVCEKEAQHTKNEKCVTKEGARYVSPEPCASPG